ncbi:hypothetical protein MASR1M45_30830 [Candidatus Kapaibacterium sp.]
MKKIFISIFITLLFINFSFARADEDSLSYEKEKMIVYDLQSYRYNFFKGDTLVYRVEAFDSLMINYDKPLEKTRLEHLQVTCDSVTKDRKFLLSFKLISLISDEVYDGKEKSRRTSSAWKGRVVKILIDSLGNRLKVVPDDSLSYSVAPGGSFTPALIFPFKETYRYINESWMAKSKDTLIENGVPGAWVDHTFLLRARNPLDTLGYACSRFSYIMTGIGAINIITPQQKMRTESTLTGSGVMTISKEHWIPVHYFANLEQKLLIFYPEKEEIPGQHYISVDFTLEKFIPGKGRTGDTKKQVKKKK